MKKPRTYTVHHADGTKSSFTLEKKASLKELQAWVGGYIEPVLIGPGRHGYVNEEGWIIGLPVNASFPSFAGAVVECPKGCWV